VLGLHLGDLSVHPLPPIPPLTTHDLGTDQRVVVATRLFGRVTATLGRNRLRCMEIGGFVEDEGGRFGRRAA
jgi:hypothetical protein